MNWSIRIDGAHLNSGDGVTFFWTAHSDKDHLVIGAWFPANGFDLKTTAERVIRILNYQIKQITCEPWAAGTDNYKVPLKPEIQ